MVRFELPKEQDHEANITGFDIDLKTGLFVTSDMAGKVKIWNATKQLVREIIFPSKVHSVQFMSYKGDILVAH